jgi:hypothetical protein
MKPGVDHLLMLMAGTLATKISDAMPADHYAAGDAKMLALLNILLAQEIDRAADRLVRENGALRALFARAAPHLPPLLRERVAEVAASSDANLLLSTLEGGNALLKDLLIEVHIVAETETADWAAPLNRDILALLKQGAQDRMFVLPPV